MSPALPRPTLLSQRQFGRFVLAVIMLGFFALIGAGADAGYTIWQDQQRAQWVEHTYQVLDGISRMRTLAERTESARRGFLLNRSPEARSAFVESTSAMPASVATIAELTRDNPSQQVRVGQLQALVAQHLQQLGRSIALATRDPAAARASFVEDGSGHGLSSLRALADDMAMEENRLLDQRREEQRAGVERLLRVLEVTGALLMVVAIVSIMVIRRYTLDLVRSRDTVAGLNQELEGRVAERTRDLTRANEEIQRFAYIVSHDLRSPLVNVMGFTGELDAAAKPLARQFERIEQEAPHLLDQQALLAAREDLPEAIGFIRASTQKMDRLINSILKLSREGKRVLTFEPLDLGAIADGIVASLHHRLDEIGAEVSVHRPMPRLVSDRLAVEQMLSNLVENAVKYLQPGRPGRIAVSARSDGMRVTIDVADNGRGIDPKDHERIFELFRRSGMQDQPGEGIGLAHVRALAYRLGGLVDCRSALGEGATFSLTLPALPPAGAERGQMS